MKGRRVLATVCAIFLWMNGAEAAQPAVSIRELRETLPERWVGGVCDPARRRQKSAGWGHGGHRRAHHRAGGGSCPGRADHVGRALRGAGRVSSRGRKHGESSGGGIFSGAGRAPLPGNGGGNLPSHPESQRPGNAGKRTGGVPSAGRNRRGRASAGFRMAFYSTFHGIPYLIGQNFRLEVPRRKRRRNFCRPFRPT